MKEKEFGELMENIQSKIGEDASNLILDDIGTLINDNKKMNEDYEKQVSENESLKKRNETLQNVNGNLLQQISMGTEDEIIDKGNNKEEQKKYIDYKLAFDEKRKFQTIV